MTRLLIPLVALMAGQVHATETAGMIKVAKGAVIIEREGGSVEASVGTPVLVSDRIRTGSDSAVGITLRDNTCVSAGPNSRFVMDKFAYDTTTHKGNMDVNINRGTVSVVSGKIAKASPENVVFRTPASVLGLRGTEFAVEVRGNDD